jgi:crotonobetainyl-CoA:carnitine CoA-transferase CaiB-like acyl-CoA transferase
MIDAAAYFLMGDMASKHTLLPHERGIHPPTATPEPYATADGYITIAPLTDRHWTALLKAVGHPEWFEGNESRAERVRRSAKGLIALFPTQPSAYWIERIEAADVPCGRVNDFDTVWEDDQFAANETFFEYDHPKAGRARGVRSPVRFSRTNPELWRHAPELGQNTDEILGDLGFRADEIAGLRERRLVA